MEIHGKAPGKSINEDEDGKIVEAKRDIHDGFSMTMLEDFSDRIPKTTL